MDEEDWDAIIKIIGHLNEGMIGLHYGRLPVRHIDDAIKVAENRKAQIHRENNHG